MKPVLQALVLADHVYTDKTGKKIIAGTFSGIQFSRKPLVKEVERLDGTKQTLVPGGMHSGSPWIYISLTDLCEKTDFLLQFVFLTKNVVLFTMAVTVTCTDRLANVELVVPLPPLNAKEAGVYAIEVVCEGEILGSWRVKAEEMKTAQEQ